LFPGAARTPPLAALPPLPGEPPMDRASAALAAVRGRMEVCGPITAAELADCLALPVRDVDEALAALEGEGQALRGRFRPEASLPPGAAASAVDGTERLEWCDRRLLQRIHRLTVGRLRREIDPLNGPDFMRFLFRWHGVSRAGGAAPKRAAADAL